MSAIAFVTLVNDTEQLARCQDSLRPQVDPFPDWLAVEPNPRGWNAAEGLNHGIETVDAEWVVCVHQDVLFPAGFWSRFTAALAALPADAALAGVVGCERRGWYRGHIQDPNGHCFWGPLPRDVLTLDEVLIAVRKSSGLRFDPEVPGFHCYGSDICLQAEQRGLRTVAIDAPIVHLSTGRVDEHYERASAWLLAKWGPRFGWVLPMPAMLVRDEERSSWLRRTAVRWRRRRDRLARNRNDCGHSPCGVALAGGQRSVSAAT
ncbi:MAG: glycosyltransferase [Planctomycetes bacterium]|nr:glycosyltransferase [Planctomycetota bacterium]